MYHEPDIEKLFRKQFKGYSINPSSGLWSRLGRKLQWREFLRFGWDSFNVYYAGIMVAGAGIALGISLIGKPSVEISTTGNDKTVSDTLYSQGKPSEGEMHAGKVREEAPSAEMEYKHESILKKPVNEAVKRASGTAEMHADVQPSPSSEPERKGSEPEREKENMEMSPLPVAGYFLSPMEGCIPLTVMCVSLSEYAEDYLWHFGDGGVSYEENPSYIFDEPGIYPVSLKVVNEQGESVLTRDTIKVYAAPDAVFEISPAVPDLPDEPVYFYNYSRNASRYLWDFGDGKTSEEMEPLHRYAKAGSYDVMLVAFSEGGCADTALVSDAFGGEECSIVFPNAFMPDPAGPTGGYYNPADPGNTVFHPVCRGVATYQLRIFNRTGLLVFESNQVETGWDGYINGTPAKQDVYVWKVRGTFNNGKSFVHHGNVTLIWNR